MAQEVSPDRQQLGKTILAIGSLPSFIIGGLLVLGGLLVFMMSAANQSDSAMVDPAGFGMFFGFLALLPGIIMLFLTYLSRLGPRNPTLTIFGASGNILIGLFSAFFIASGTAQGFSIFLAPLLICILAGFSSLASWWLRKVLSVGWLIFFGVFSITTASTFLVQGLTEQTAKTVLGTHTGPVYSVSWSPDGNKLVSSGLKEIIIWDIKDKTPISTPANLVGSSAAWSPDGSLIATSAFGFEKATISIFDAQSGMLQNQFETDSIDVGVSQIVWSPNNKRVLFLYRGGFFVWDVESAEPETFEIPENLKGIFWSSDSRLIQVTYGVEFTKEYDQIRLLYMRDADTGQPLSQMQIDKEPQTVSFSPNEKWLVSDSALMEWGTGNFISNLNRQGIQGNLSKVVWSPDGTKIAGIIYDKVILWEAATGKRLKTFNGHNKRIADIAWSPDGKNLALSVDQTIIIWQIKP